MKKIMLMCALLFATFTMYAQGEKWYVGGTVNFWHDNDEDNTTFTLAPEVGYNFNEQWSVGGEIAFSHSSPASIKRNAFWLAPYARYTFLRKGIFGLFVDGGLGFSTSKVKSHDAENGFEIGFKPGFFLQVSDNFRILAKYGFLGYRDDFANVGSKSGLVFDTNDLRFGIQYQF